MRQSTESIYSLYYVDSFDLFVQIMKVFIVDHES
jgi:hypothetical protein